MVDSFELDPQGFDELVDALEKLERDAIAEMRGPMQQAMLYLWQQLPPYPPPLPDSRYRRRGSGGLAGSYSTDVRTTSTEVVGVIGAGIAYAPYVIGLADQAAIHQDRWWTLDEVVEEHVDGAVEILEKGIDDILEDL